MGLFGKKDEAEATADAPAADAGGEEMMTCEKCHKQFPKSEGNMVLAGSAFCCKNCCPEGKNGTDEDDGTCEFC